MRVEVAQTGPGPVSTSTSVPVLWYANCQEHLSVHDHRVGHPWPFNLSWAAAPGCSTFFRCDRAAASSVSESHRRRTVELLLWAMESRPESAAKCRAMGNAGPAGLGHLVSCLFNSPVLIYPLGNPFQTQFFAQSSGELIHVHCQHVARDSTMIYWIPASASTWGRTLHLLLQPLIDALHGDSLLAHNPGLSIGSIANRQTAPCKGDPS